MKYAKRRWIAYCIDSLVVCLPVVVILALMHIVGIESHPIVAPIIHCSVSLPLVCILYILCPLVFKNASVGMKITGLEILNKDFKRPTVKQIVRRQIKMPLWNIKKFAFFFSGESIDNWELEKLGTQVVRVKNND